MTHDAEDKSSRCPTCGWDGFTCHECDGEWFQIIESGLGFHPVSRLDALNKLIEKGKEAKGFVPKNHKDVYEKGSPKEA